MYLNIMDNLTQSQIERIGLFLSAVLLCTGILYSISHPVTEYSVSIYSANRIFWVCCILSMCIASVISLHGDKPKYSWLIICIGVVTVSLAPIILGYYFHAAGDGLTQMGWLRSIQSGELDLFSLRYVGLHLFTLEFSSLLGQSIRRSLMLSILPFSLLYVLFLPVIIRALSRNVQAYRIGFVLGSMLSVIDAFSTRLTPHPFSLAMISLPFAFLLYTYSTSRPEFSRSQRIVIGGLPVLFISITHPLAGLLVSVVILISVLFRTIVISRSYNNYTTFVVVILAVSIPVFYRVIQHFMYQRALLAIISRVQSINILNYFSSQSGSISSSGSSVSSVIFNLYGVEIFLCVVSAFILLYIMYTKFYTGESSPTDLDILSLSFGFSLILFCFLAFLAADYGEFSYRLIAMLVFLAVIIVGVYFTRSVITTEICNSRTVSVGITILIIICLVLSLQGAYATQDTLRPNKHITETNMDGFEWMFEYENPRYEHAEVRSEVFRYRYAIEGTGRRAWLNRQMAPDHFNNQDISSEYNSSRYFVITSSDIVRETELYSGFRFNESDFEYLDRDRHLNKLYSNDGLKWYLITNNK